MKKILLICLMVLLLFASSVTIAATKETLEVPAKVKVISQSCSQTFLFITVIDLSNNEIVILCYGLTPSGLGKVSFTLHTVTRTGMFVDPDTQNPVNGQDAPFESSQK